MEKRHFQNKAVIDEPNAIFILFFDAETKEAITYNNNHTFYFKPNGTDTGIHELATALTINDQVVYPTLTILGTDDSIIFQQHSVISTKAMLTILQRFIFEKIHIPMKHYDYILLVLA
jgi:hypothetical protein